MIKKFFFLFFFGALLSCSKDKTKIVEADIIGSWKLYEMSGSFENSETTGEDMDWQETYQFNADASFQKTRVRYGVTTTIEGTFLFSSDYDEVGLSLTYFQESDIIGDCIAEPVEYLAILSSSRIANSWAQCDGPLLKYEKVD